MRLHRNTAPARRPRTTRTLGVTLAAVLGLSSLAACAEEEPVDAGGGAADDEATATAFADPEGVLGLEVTVVGDVGERIDQNAFRVDKDGLDAEDDEFAAGTDYYDYDFDYYDRDGLTAYDEDFGLDDSQEDSVLVIVPDGSATVTEGEDVRVSGTVRALDDSTIEAAYGVELDPDLYEPFQDKLVIVAQSVNPAQAEPTDAATSSTEPTQGASAEPSSEASATPSTAESTTG